MLLEWSGFYVQSMLGVFCGKICMMRSKRVVATGFIYILEIVLAEFKHFKGKNRFGMRFANYEVDARSR
jgi:hypothetical protein